ncbi:hypothetical protein GQ43DRAFT_466917 [Delitschia confertaspora ATCC 74209]|uniref:Uncharacterized protein n=1 Tax=Delitschia confertaspora ATCC 74209 TaxID=1513339 RepID=A0A9P4JCS1_9PLEO|nr:hypothetical protein GQ43DRAFT_466917 [Delitschia confertaspora ATCC 74209]
MLWPLLMFILLLLTTALGVAAYYPDCCHGVPGVAFGLTPDYGVASIYFKNGTSVPVAQIQGCPGYQAFMRNHTASTAAETSPLDRAQDSGGIVTWNQHLLRRDHFTGVEDYRADTKDYRPGIQGYRPEVVQETLHAIGLRQAKGWALPAGKLTVSEIMKNEILQDEEQVILAVDYSSHGFSLGLYIMDELGIVDTLKEEYHPRIGSVKGARENEPGDLGALKDALQVLLGSKPLAGYKLPVPLQIQHLIVYGDLARGDALRYILTAVLEAGLVENARISHSLFAGTASMAKMAYHDMWWINSGFNTGHRIRDAAFGCRWRSKLYRKGHDEL